MTNVLHFATRHSPLLGTIPSKNNVHNVRCVWHHVPLPDMEVIRYRGWFDLLPACWQLFCLLYRLRPRHCYAYTPWAGILLGLWTPVLSYRLWYVQWALPTAYQQFADLLCGRLALALASEVVAPSQAVYEELLDVCLLPVDRVHYRFPMLRVPTDQLRWQWHSRLRQVHRLGMVPLLGTPVMVDGSLERIVQAFTRLRAAQPELRLLLLPNPGITLRVRDRRLLQALPADSWLDFSQEADAQQVYSLANWFVYTPQRVPGFDLPLAWAMSVGLPIVSVPEVGVLAVEGHNAFLLPDHTPESIAWGVQCLQADSYNTILLGRMALSTARHHFLPMRQAA